jgi:pyrophosphatase PpaX
MMNLIKAVLFDLDGTLIDTNKLVIESFKHTLRNHLNKEISAGDIVNYFGEPLTTTLERYDKNNVEELLKTYKEFNEAKHDELACEINYAIETVKELRKLNIKIAVVTSKRRLMAERGLKLFGLFDLIDILITPEDTMKHKPNGEPAEKACERLQVYNHEALMVGDSHFDILCGKNAGCKTCVVGYTALPIEAIMKYNPDYKIESLRDLLNIIEMSVEAV